MPRRWLQGRLPDNRAVERRLGLSNPAPSRLHERLRGWLRDPMLWHLNRHSVAGAMAVGLFLGWLPIPFQMIVAACCAVLLRVHVPVSVVMVWITNPLTIGPMMYFAWTLATRILGMQAACTPNWQFQTVPRLLSCMAESWPVVLAGCLFCGAVSAVLGFGLTHLAWRVATLLRWRRSRRTVSSRTAGIQ